MAYIVMAYLVMVTQRRTHTHGRAAAHTRYSAMLKAYANVVPSRPDDAERMLHEMQQNLHEELRWP